MGQRWTAGNHVELLENGEEFFPRVYDAIRNAQREVIVLKIWGDLTFAQIAQTLGESINTVASRYRYALEALRKHIKPHEYERV